MKKLLSILLAIFVILSFAACGQDSGNDSDDGDTKVTDKEDNDNKETTGNDGTTGESQNGDNTPESTTGGGSSNETPSGNGGGNSGSVANKVLKTEVAFDGYSIEFKWTEKDASTGTIVVSQIITATADETALVGLTGALKVAPEITEYTVTYTKGADGGYIAEGAVSAVSAKVEGEAAQGFIDLTKMGLDDSNYSQLTKKVLDGDVLTAKADIEAYLMAIDSQIKISFTVQGDKISVSTYEHIYTSWGDRIATKDIYRIEGSYVKTWEEYENNELFCVSTFRSNGIIEKLDFYSNGVINDTTYFDENGEVKESNKDVMSPSVDTPSNDDLANSTRG